MNQPFGTRTMRLNGVDTPFAAAPGRRLSEVLREDLQQFGTKIGCDAGDCGACTVLLNGSPVCACLTPAIRVDGAEVTTVEGVQKIVPMLQRSFLRHGAAQCGICTPGMLVAAAALLQKNASPSRREVEDALGGVLCRCTGYAKIIDAVCDMSGLSEPDSPKTGAAVGARLERLDGGPKVAGTEVYGADLVLPDTLEVRAIRSPHHAATFTLGDTAAWTAAAPGPVLVLTAADIPGPNLFGTIPDYVDQPVLAETSVRQRGEAIAIVVAETAVLDALDLSTFPVKWTPTPAVTDLASAPPADLHPHRPGNLMIRGLVRCGDTTAALRDATFVSDAQVETGFVEHAYIEPEAGIAWMDGDTLVIRACTQAPVMDRDETAKVLALPTDRVRVQPAATGGGFGAKLDVSLQPLIGLATLKTGRPCRMIYSRSESMASTTKRHPAKMKGRAGCDAAGHVTGMTFDGDFNTGAYASWGPTVAVRVPVHASGPYRTPNYHAEARAMHTNGPAAGAFRGFGVPQAALVQETLYDDLAIKAGIDRLEFRIVNALRDGDTTVCGQTPGGIGIAECLEALRPAWQQALARADTTDPRRLRGVGVASCWYGCGNTGLPNPSTIRAGLRRDGTLVLHQGAADIGQGANTVIAQIFADALGLPVGQVALIDGDTALTPDCGKTSASRQTFVTGNAALRAGQMLRSEILSLTNAGAAAKLSLQDGALTVTDGRAIRTIHLADLPANPLGYVLSAEETYDPPTRPLDENGQGEPYAVYGYGAQVAEVEVDATLGTVRVLHMTAAHDLGRVMNPLLAEGQVEGGIAQGLGMALMEEYIPGRTENLHDYLIPTTGDMPEIQTIFIEKPDPEGPLGAKGLGEHVLIPTAPAILNGIRHASGARITRLPALPHRVLAAIREAGQ
ncbi:molybdopterin-dependent oxidoreductase [Psychromarinibacter halotolerans]|uniref:Molybdopterin-dependent oxidoreductase n=1 Tax=Psychromarinibacter halotolerans TaxID=1775175 RepID=A0ABV7GNB4_9RHOB|nr:molybdopterin cofactor-binding domain-containing protein [Psychromarinibacter halotolerans]MDF0595566.1 molybdopterin-dependent oxidoreductase [Psychromarinibacter halotolerans]